MFKISFTYVTVLARVVGTFLIPVCAVGDPAVGGPAGASPIFVGLKATANPAFAPRATVPLINPSAVNSLSFVGRFPTSFTTTRLTILLTDSFAVPAVTTADSRSAGFGIAAAALYKKFPNVRSTMVSADPPETPATLARRNDSSTDRPS